MNTPWVEADALTRYAATSGDGVVSLVCQQRLTPDAPWGRVLPCWGCPVAQAPSVALALLQSVAIGEGRVDA